jgi:tryptophanase
LAGTAIPFEPYRIRSVQALPFTTIEEREDALERAGWNLFELPAELVTIDLLTDSGANGASTAQLAAAADSDEAYAGSRSWRRMRDAVTWLTGFPEIIPTPQGRTAEALLLEQLVQPGDLVPGNAHYNTTRANIEWFGGEALDLMLHFDACDPNPFKGDLDTCALESILADPGSDRVVAVIVTVTNIAVGGHPVSLSNIAAVSRFCHKHRIPFFLDACRYAENAWLMRARDQGLVGRSLRDLVREMSALADGCWVSAKKDGLANIGGYLALRDHQLAERCRRRLRMIAGLPTYGGLAGYDLEIIATGIPESVDERLLAHRAHQIEVLAAALRRAGVPIIEPPGGHAVFIDAAAFLPHVPSEHFPGQALAVELYRAGAVRSSEVGSLMLGRTDRPWPWEMTKLSIPRRSYTDNQLRYVAAVLADLYLHRDQIPGLRLIADGGELRHFSARFTPTGVRR